MDQSSIAIVNHVTVNEHVPGEDFNRYVDHCVQQWLAKHAWLTQGEHADYDVAFYDEESLGEVSCLVVLREGEQMWRAWESGDNPKVALARCLDHLREDVASVQTDRSNSHANH